MEQICALEGCGVTFIARVHNQRFHSRECCRVYTNKRILAQYHEKKNRDLKNRTCSTKGCSTVLSIYNQEDMCSIHQQARFTAKLEAWGWEVNEDDCFI